MERDYGIKQKSHNKNSLDTFHSKEQIGAGGGAYGTEQGEDGGCQHEQEDDPFSAEPRDDVSAKLHDGRVPVREGTQDHSLQVVGPVKNSGLPGKKRITK